MASVFKSPEGEAEYLAAYQATLEHWPIEPEERYIEGDFGATHVLIAGPSDGPPLVALPGGAMSATMWAPNIADLSREHRVYAVDVMGDFGKSKPTRALRNRGDHVAWLVALLDALELSRPALLGHSFGGWVAASLATAGSNRIGGLALTAPAATLQSLRLGFALRGLWTAIGASQAKARRYMRYAATENPARPDEHGAILDCLAEQMYLGFKHARGLIGAYPTRFRDRELGQIQCPTLVLVGAEEVIYRPEAAIARAQALIPRCRAEIIENASHDLTVAQPDRVNRAILSFLAGAGDLRDPTDGS